MPTSYPVFSEMADPASPDESGRAVSLQVSGGSTYWLSPGGSVTISGNKGTIIDISTADGDFLVVPDPTGDSLLIRVDAQMTLIGHTFYGTGSDGVKIVPQFDMFEFVGDIMQNMTDKTTYLIWRAKTFTGMVKNFTITQRAGEGNLVDLSFTFQVGVPTASEEEGFWESFWG